MLLRLLIFMLFLTAMNVFPQTPTIEPGVSQGLAKWRAAHYSDVRYKLNLTLEKGDPLMNGDIEIRVNLTEEGAKNDLLLDWRATQFANDKDKPFAGVIQINDAIDVISTVVNEHLIVSKDALKPGENVIKVRFASPIKTSGAAITRYIDKEDNAEYIYSLFVPSDASTAFPVFDQPDLKARFTLEVNSRTFERVVSNAIGKTTDYNTNTNKFTFSETKPISTYVFAFAAGDFVSVEENPAKDEAGRSIKAISMEGNTENFRVFVRRSQYAKFKQHEKEVFRLNRDGVKFLESYFDYKFPFPKYDIVLIPEFPFGGMEHAGFTFLREDRVIFPTEPTKNDYITRANLIFHEAAHQWFGDTVTMKWFDDLWLKEGFAEFMAYKTLEKVIPEYNAWKIFYERNKQAAYLTDSTKGTTPIYQEIPNLSAAKSAYGNIVYRKAPSFLKQAEFLFGTDKFQTAVRSFLKKNEFKNAEWTDLVKEFETVSKFSEGRLKEWSETWIKQRGLGKMSVVAEDIPTGEVIVGQERGSFYSLRQENVPDFRQGNKWTQALKFYVISEDNRQIVFNFTFVGAFAGGSTDGGSYQGVQMNNTDFWGKSTKTESLSYIHKPVFIFPNYQDYGYGIFLLDKKSRAYVLENIQNEKDDFLRTMMWGSLWDSVREAELAPKDYVELIIKNLSLETDESTIQTLLGRVSTAMNYYLTDKQREELTPKVEKLLIDKMLAAPMLGQRITFFRAFSNTASSEKARTILKDIKSDKLKIKDLNLKLKDRYDILIRLGILGDKEATEEIYKKYGSHEMDKMSDEERRYAFASGASIADAEIKKYYFDNFVNNKNISESWIESAFVSFNSPRHSNLTLPYLEKALAELPNLKKNRKIFFVNGWLAAFIGGQRSEEALKIVNKFLADNPKLDKDLRLKILENADNLERAVKIRAKYSQ